MRQTREHADFLHSIGWEIEETTVHGRTVFAFVRHLPLIPVSVIKLQRVPLEDIDWKWLTALEKKHHTFETYLELEGLTTEVPRLEPAILSQGFQATHDFMLTTKTRVLDLTKTEVSLLAEMKPKCRYNIALATRKGLSVHFWSGKEILSNPHLYDQLYEVMKQNAKRIDMVLLPKSWIRNQFEAFGDLSFAAGVRQHNDPTFISASCFFLSPDTCFYSHNGSTAMGRTLMAPSLLLWESIKKAKAMGLSEFDFDGVYDERVPKKRWLGFTRFKTGFGGSEKYFAPMYRRLRWPW